MQQYLKIKIKSLAEEARIIRKEENRQLTFARRASYNQKAEYEEQHRELYVGLHHHRILNVRIEARASLLAYTYMRSKPRSQCERGIPPLTIREKARGMLGRFGCVPPTEQSFTAWCKE